MIMNFLVIFFVWFFAFSPALADDIVPLAVNSSDPDSNQPTRKVRRMVGGQQVSIESFPWTTFVVSRGRCGGALIDPQYVLTAAHCVNTPNPYVYYGIDHHGTASEANRREVIKIFKPPRNLLTTADLALLKLDEPVPIGPNVKPIRLNDNRQAIVKRIGTVAGFGRSHIRTDRLMAGQFEIQPVFLISTRDVIGGRSPYQSPCYGDSGSGLIVERDGEPYLVGITSAILSAGCQPNNLALYTDVAYYHDWIMDHMDQSFTPQDCLPVHLPWNFKFMYCASSLMHSVAATFLSTLRIPVSYTYVSSASSQDHN